jgi:hypothetical protein
MFGAGEFQSKKTGKQTQTPMGLSGQRKKFSKT